MILFHIQNIFHIFLFSVAKQNPEKKEKKTFFKTIKYMYFRIKFVVERGIFIS